jgi:hypothetical protein
VQLAAASVGSATSTASGSAKVRVTAALATQIREAECSEHREEIARLQERTEQLKQEMGDAAAHVKEAWLHNKCKVAVAAAEDASKRAAERKALFQETVAKQEATNREQLQTIRAHSSTLPARVFGSASVTRPVSHDAAVAHAVAMPNVRALQDHERERLVVAAEERASAAQCAHAAQLRTVEDKAPSPQISNC